MKPIDLHLINAKFSFDKAVNHAFDLGWDAHQEHILKALSEVETNQELWAGIDFAISLIRVGIEVTYEAPAIGKSGNGVHLHITDELDLIKGENK